MLLIQWWRYYEEIKGLRKTSKKEKRKLGRRKKKISLVKIFDEVNNYICRKIISKS